VIERRDDARSAVLTLSGELDLVSAPGLEQAAEGNGRTLVVED